MRVIVMGAGVLAAGVARSLAASGIDVLLPDRRKPEARTTATKFAWTNANGKLASHQHRLNVAGIDELAQLGPQGDSGAGAQPAAGRAHSTPRPGRRTIPRSRGRRPRAPRHA